MFFWKFDFAVVTHNLAHQKTKVRNPVIVHTFFDVSFISSFGLFEESFKERLQLVGRSTQPRNVEVIQLKILCPFFKQMQIPERVVHKHLDFFSYVGILGYDHFHDFYNFFIVLLQALQFLRPLQILQNLKEQLLDQKVILHFRRLFNEDVKEIEAEQSSMLVFVFVEVKLIFDLFQNGRKELRRFLYHRLVVTNDHQLHQRVSYRYLGKQVSNDFWEILKNLDKLVISHYLFKTLQTLDRENPPLSYLGFYVRKIHRNRVSWNNPDQSQIY